jgi:hypothetical protein
MQFLIADCFNIQLVTGLCGKDTHRKPLVPNLRVAESEASNRVYCYSLIWDEIVL